MENRIERQKSKLRLIEELDRLAIEQFGRDDAVESAIRNYELAAQMQTAVPELMALDQETKETKEMYGMEASYGPTKIFAAECLIARRLVERGYGSLN